MTAINFTDEELEHLRGYYQIELVEAEKDVKRIRDILSKLENSKPAKQAVIIEKVPGKRGRKPKVVTDEIAAPVLNKKGRKPGVAEVVIKERKPRADKGTPRGKRVRPDLIDLPANKPDAPVADSKPVKPAIPKKAKKKKQYRKRGITLAPMGRPLPKRAPDPGLPPSEEVQDSAE